VYLGFVLQIGANRLRKVSACSRVASTTGRGRSPAPLVELAEFTKVVVNLRFDGAPLAKIDAAAKRQGITRTACLYCAAFDALGGPE
jgi:hypothetical protein